MQEWLDWTVRSRQRTLLGTIGLWRNTWSNTNTNTKGKAGEFGTNGLWRRDLWDIADGILTAFSSPAYNVSCLRNFHVIHTLFWCTNVWNSVVQKPIWENSWKTAKLIADKGSWGVDCEVLLPGFGLDNRLPALSTLGTTNTFCYFDKYIVVYK